MSILASQFYRFFDVGFMRFLLGMKMPNVYGFTRLSQASLPSFSGLNVAGSSYSLSVSNPAIVGVLGNSSLSKIGNAIVRSIAIDVVDTDRPCAVSKKPRESVPFILPTFKLNANVALSGGCASYFAKLPLLVIADLYPDKMTRIGVILKVFFQFIECHVGRIASYTWKCKP